MFPGETLKTIVLELKRKFDREIVIEDPSLEKNGSSATCIGNRP